jgi:hypothetical protein
MPWKASSVMEERLRFVACLLNGETVTDVCREFGVARKTGHKTLDRYKVHGLTALSDPSRRPVRSRDRLVRPELVTLVLGATCYPCLRAGHCLNGGESGIRTHGTVSRTHAFQACALSHSAISPDAFS